MAIDHLIHDANNVSRNQKIKNVIKRAINFVNKLIEQIATELTNQQLRLEEPNNDIGEISKFIFLKGKIFQIGLPHNSNSSEN